METPNLHYQPDFDTLDRLHSKQHSNLRFNDKIRIKCQGGNGGQGCVSFEAHARKRGKPDGGSGGVGGDVVIECVDAIGGFQFSKRSFRAQNGSNGYCSKQHGARGKDEIIPVPKGTVIKQLGVYRTYDKAQNNHIYDADSKLLTELMEAGDSMIIAKGGNGGKGNLRLKNAENNHPRWSEMGEVGECVLLELELKCIADIGFVGYPNAGKSTLLSALSRAKPAISSLPFTTLNPHIGHVEVVHAGNTLKCMSIADLPGIIEGASNDRGLGLEFLKHIERCKVLVYILDIIGSDNRCPIEDFNKLRYELYCYDPLLIASKPSIIFANKCDIVDDYDELYKDQLIGYDDKLSLMRCVNERIAKLKEIVAADGIPIIKGSGVKKEFDDLLSLSQSMIKEYDKSMKSKQQKNRQKCTEIWTEDALDSSDSESEIPSWGNVMWLNEDEDEEDCGDVNNECHTKMEHQSASKQYYQKFDANHIHRYEYDFQQSTKHSEPAPNVKYETFKFEDETLGHAKDNEMESDESNEEELGNIFNISSPRKEKQKHTFSKLEKLK